ncbi:MAG: Rieske 2Fe-2S domain-containing protein [bacterium]|nr:Rieske 2Fe-2S domain-containing protein [bacterium]
MHYQSGVRYSAAGDIYVRKTSFRKIILRTMIILAIGAFFLYPLVRYLTAPPNMMRYLETVQISLATLPEGTSQLISYHGQPVLVINYHGNIKALSAICTYNSALLRWDNDREELVCSSHDARYDINGNVKAGLAPRPLEQLEVMVVEGSVIIGKS